MGIASFVLGIVGFVGIFIPCFNYLAILIAIVGLILGIVDVVRRSKTKEAIGFGITGIILSAITLLILMFIFFAAFVVGVAMYL